MKAKQLSILLCPCTLELSFISFLSIFLQTMDICRTLNDALTGLKLWSVRTNCSVKAG